MHVWFLVEIVGGTKEGGRGGTGGGAEGEDLIVDWFDILVQSGCYFFSELNAYMLHRWLSCTNGAAAVFVPTQ